MADEKDIFEIEAPSRFFTPISGCQVGANNKTTKIENWGDTASEVLMAIHVYVNSTWMHLPEFTKEEVYKKIEEFKKRRNEGGDPIINLEGKELGAYGETVNNLDSEEMQPFESLIDSVRRFCRLNFPYNHQRVCKLFNNTEIFPVILEAMGIMSRLDNILEVTLYNLQYHRYYRDFNKLQVIEYFGESALDHYEPDRELTEDDYKNILDTFCDYLDSVQKSKFREKLSDLAQQISVFHQYFIKAKSPTNPQGDTDAKYSLAPAKEKAYQSYGYAVGKNSSLKTDKEVYDWLKEQGFDGYELPTLDTWKRQVGAGRKFYGTQKNTPRAGRKAPAIKAQDDPGILNQISNQYPKPD